MLHEIKNLENFQAPQTAGLRINGLKFFPNQIHFPDVKPLRRKERRAVESNGMNIGHAIRELPCRLGRG
jgi:hypothetical protein